MAAYTTIDNPELYFQAVIYTGNGGTNAITLPGSENMSPDLVWCAERNDTSSPKICDTVRGTETVIRPDGTTVEASDSGVVTSFDSDGFTHGADNGINESGNTNVGWCWVESATAGFDIVGYDSTTSAKTESHSLSAVPHFMIIKRRDRGTNNWPVYHHKNTAAPETDFLRLNTDDATADNANIFNDTAPTSSVFSVGSGSEVNDGHTPARAYITYLWSEKQGFSKFGSYEGNGDADGTFVYTGFRPAYVMCKSIDSTSEWFVFDNKRSPFNPVDDNLYANSHLAENTTTNIVDFLSNGFKIRVSIDPNIAETFVYVAFAKAPFVNSEGVPCNAR